MTASKSNVETAIIQDFRVYADAVARAYTDALVASLQAEVRKTISELEAARGGTEAAARAITVDIENATSAFKQASTAATHDVAGLGARLDGLVRDFERNSVAVADRFKQQLEEHASRVSAAQVREFEAARTALVRYGDTQTEQMKRTARFALAIAVVQLVMLGVILWRVFG